MTAEKKPKSGTETVADDDVKKAAKKAAADKPAAAKKATTAKKAAPATPAAKKAAARKASTAKLSITQVRSQISFARSQRKVLAGLGLGRIGKSVIRHDDPCIRGMGAKVAHLVRVEEVEAWRWNCTI